MPCGPCSRTWSPHEVRLDRIREHAATRRWGVTTAFLIAGTLLFVVVVAQLAAQRRISEARRRRSEDEQRLLQAVFAGIDDGITLQDRTGKVIFANAAAARMIGFASSGGAARRVAARDHGALRAARRGRPPLPARQAAGARGADRGTVGQGGHPLPLAQGGPVALVGGERAPDHRRRRNRDPGDQRLPGRDGRARRRRTTAVPAARGRRAELVAGLRSHARGGGAARRPRPGGLVRGRHRRRGSGETSRHRARRSGQGGVRRRAGPALPAQSVLQDRRARDHSHAASRS